MPTNQFAPPLRSAITSFQRAQTRLLKTAEGTAQRTAVQTFGTAVAQAARQTDVLAQAAPDAALQQAATASLAWMARLPPALVQRGDVPLVDFGSLKPAAAAKAASDALQVLSVGAQALLRGAQAGLPGFDKTGPAVITSVAFQVDKASGALREPIVQPPKGTGLPPMPGPAVPAGLAGLLPSPAWLDRMVRAGALAELLQAFGRAGQAAQDARDWAARVQAIGQVVRITPARACAGTPLRIELSGIDLAALPAGAEVVLALPTRSGCCHRRLRDLLVARPVFALDRPLPRMLRPNLHVRPVAADVPPALPAGHLLALVTAPDDISTGVIGCFLVPPPRSQVVEPGALGAAAAQWQSALAEGFGAAGIQQAEPVVRLAATLEAASLSALPCAVRQADGANGLLAGSPVIEAFRVVEPGPVHPRGTLTLEWQVSNADAVSIAVRTRPGSLNPCELPNVPQPLATSGRITLQVPCTGRWEGQYVLEASNGNACGAPVVATADVSSGFAHWRVGAARADITDRRPGLGFYGFSYERQTSSGQLHRDVHGQPLPLYARAFVVEELRLPSDRRHLAIVVCDLWTCSIAVKRAVVERLNAAGARQYDDANLLIAGTHTHAGPGGYSEYPLYNLTCGAFDPVVFDVVVNGIVAAVRGAEARLARGRILVAEGELASCGANRSFEAYQRNPEYQAGAGPDQWIDRRMLLLKFVADVDGFGATRPVGLLDWYGIHPTSLGMFNLDISGDNKGWAAMLVEDALGAEAPGFVAAFGNACAGDVSGNVTLDEKGRKTVRRPMGDSRVKDGLKDDLAAMQALGQLQADQARALYDAASFEVTGRLDARHRFIDMSSQTIDTIPGARTWPAMMGVSFGAGSSEDSIAYVSMGIDIDPAIPEGMTRADFTAGGVAFWGLMAAQFLVNPVAVGAVAAAVTGGVLPPTAVLAQAWPLIAALVIPGARAYAAAPLGACFMPDRLPLPSQGRWRWEVPGALGVPADIVAGHGDKPIMFAPGVARLVQVLDDGRQGAVHDYPLVPHVIPMQLLRLGSVVLAGVPAEFTATAGRRLRLTLEQTLAGAASHLAVANYANGYSGYVATREEYGAQHYEGASTLYGEHTLAAYQQVFAGMAQALRDGTAVEPGAAFPVPVLCDRRR